MRMRKMKNLEPRMAAVSAWRIESPEARCGVWRALMPSCTALWVELGCGKGQFTAELARQNPTVLVVAVERCREAMVVAMERAQRMELKNVYYIDADAARLEEIFAPGEIDRLYLNFPDPWPRKKNAKRRLTFRTFLEHYSQVAAPGAELHFKTDNAALFDFSLEEFAQCGLAVDGVTHDLHHNGTVGILTGYEEKFCALGTPICRCVVTLHPFRLPRENKEAAQNAE